MDALALSCGRSSQKRSRAAFQGDPHPRMGAERQAGSGPGLRSPRSCDFSSRKLTSVSHILELGPRDS